MSLFDLMAPDEKRRYHQLTIDKEMHLQRYQMCKAKLDVLGPGQGKWMVRRWLEQQPEEERELCRVVLNGIVNQRRNKI